jgi:hypothetical protein
MMTAAHARRLVYLIHRWTGVGACVLMALWLVSGTVMLFVGYPRLLPHERLQHLPVLQPAACCVAVEAALSLARAPAEVSAITLTSVAGQPRYRVKEGAGDFLMVDAVTGRRVPAVDAAAAADSARAFLPGAAARVEGQVVDDRWTHSGALDAHRPLFRVQMQDADGTVLYVSSTTGEVVMDASAVQRGWNYVGAWLHWLYMFRDGSRDPVWSWLVIVLSAVGTVSALTGAVAGIWRWRFSGRYRSGARTPYREWRMRWHHIAGLTFGGVLVTWIFSGLMSMNPFGMFDPAGERPDAGAYRQGLPGALRPDITARDALAHLRAAHFPASEIEWRVMAGEPYLLARDAAGGTRLLLAQAHGYAVRERWPDERLVGAGARLMTSGIRAARPQYAYDAYYYARNEASMYAGAERRLPVLKLEFDDAGRTSVWLDPHTGDVALSLDRSQRTGRWLFNFLHSWDLPPMLRQGSVRDGVLIVLGLGALAIAATGTLIGWRRLQTFCRHRFRGTHRRPAARVEMSERAGEEPG